MLTWRVGYDETIYPVDFRYNGHIVDDDMHAIMLVNFQSLHYYHLRSCHLPNSDDRVAPLQAGVRLTAIFDSCHSGSALDLPYLYSTQVYINRPN